MEWKPLEMPKVRKFTGKNRFSITDEFYFKSVKIKNENSKFQMFCPTSEKGSILPNAVRSNYVLNFSWENKTYFSTRDSFEKNVKLYTRMKRSHCSHSCNIVENKNAEARWICGKKRLQCCFRFGSSNISGCKKCKWNGLRILLLIMTQMM